MSQPSTGPEPTVQASSSTPLQKAGRPPSQLRTHFTELPKSGNKKYGDARCNYCDIEIPSRVERLERHILNCKNVTEDVRNEVAAAVAAPAPAQLRASGLPVLPQKRTKSSSENTVGNYFRAGPKSEEIKQWDSLLLRVFVLAGISFKVADHWAFKAFLSAICPLYSAPGENHLFTSQQNKKTSCPGVVFADCPNAQPRIWC